MEAEGAVARVCSSVRTQRINDSREHSLCSELLLNQEPSQHDEPTICEPHHMELHVLHWL